MQDAAGKVSGAAQTQYETAKDTASDLANKAQGHAEDAHGQAKVRITNFRFNRDFVQAGELHQMWSVLTNECIGHKHGDLYNGLSSIGTYQNELTG